MPIRPVLCGLACTAACLAPAAAQEMKFTDATTGAGLPAPDWPSLGGGQVTWGDYDGDGHEDLLVGCSRLYRNSGPPGYTFTQTLTLAGGNGRIWADVDNDGDLDIFCTSGTNVFYVNNGDGTFTDRTSAAGLLNRGCQAYDGTCGCTSSDAWCPWTSWPFTGAAWGDYDADGLVDLYVGNYETWNGSNLLCWPDFLYRNNGNGTFADVSWSSGVRDSDGDGAADESYGTSPEQARRCVRGVVWGDYNNDNRPDIYVSNYRIMPNTLWENRGDGTFRNVADAAAPTGATQTINATATVSTVDGLWTGRPVMEVNEAGEVVLIYRRGSMCLCRISGRWARRLRLSSSTTSRRIGARRRFDVHHGDMNTRSIFRGGGDRASLPGSRLAVRNSPGRSLGTG